MRGVVSMIREIYAKATNPGFFDFIQENPRSFIMNWDVNKLYVWAMSQYLPLGEFEWIDACKIKEDFFPS